jgi:prevent-host-death family protein
MSAARARERFSDLVSRVAYAKSRIVLTRRNRPIAAVVPLEDMELLEELEDRADLEAARKALAEVNHKGSIAWSRVKKELGLG